MTGLQGILKSFGSMKVGGVLWHWDYAKDEPVKASDMPKGSKRWNASEQAKWEAIVEQRKENCRERRDV